MYIHEAVGKALENQNALKRVAWETQCPDIIVIPTCKVMPFLKQFSI